MRSPKILFGSIIGAAIVAICCFTPFLAIASTALGVSFAFSGDRFRSFHTDGDFRGDGGVFDFAAREAKNRRRYFLDLPAMRRARSGENADQRLPMVLRLPRLRRAVASEGGRLLRVLFLRRRPLSAKENRGRMLRRHPRMKRKLALAICLPRRRAFGGRIVAFEFGFSRCKRALV